jgi:hypothetical protein
MATLATWLHKLGAINIDKSDSQNPMATLATWLHKLNIINKSLNIGVLF